MFATLKRKLKWGSIAPSDNNSSQKSHLLVAFTALLEEVLFWKTMWLSIAFIALLHVIFLVCIQKQISLLQFGVCLSITMLLMDALEAWLKHKHRTALLKRIARIEAAKLYSALAKFNQWVRKRWTEFFFVRETNHTKAFLLVNILLGMLFFLGRYISGYLLIYLFCMFLCISYKIAAPVSKLFRSMLQDIESESELEGLMPEASDIDIRLLSIEPEKNPIIDERQSLDYWKPHDISIEEASDSSDNSSSLVTNFSIEKVETLQKDVETSDSSGDEYMPLDHHKEQIQSTFEVEPSSSWGNSAYNAFWNITGAVANMTNIMQTEDGKRKHISSADSSDGFEMIDKNDLN